MTQITSHILDTSRGTPAADVQVSLQQQKGDNWVTLGSASTDSDGRIADFLGSDSILPGGIYKLTFKLGDYYKKLNTPSFYPYADIVFEINDDGQHYHVPLLLNPCGYSTYRGS